MGAERGQVLVSSRRASHLARHRGVRDRPGLRVHDPPSGAERSGSRRDRCRSANPCPGASTNRRRCDGGLRVRSAQRLLRSPARQRRLHAGERRNGASLTVNYPPSFQAGRFGVYPAASRSYSNGSTGHSSRAGRRPDDRGFQRCRRRVQRRRLEHEHLIALDPAILRCRPKTHGNGTSTDPSGVPG